MFDNHIYKHTYKLHKDFADIVHVHFSCSLAWIGGWQGKQRKLNEYVSYIYEHDRDGPTMVIIAKERERVQGTNICQTTS